MPIINMVYKKKKGWKPGANTIAYYPLTSTSTVNDMSGNNRTLTNQGSVTFSDTDGAILNSSSKRLPFPSTFIMGQVITVSVWVRHTTTNPLRILSDWSGVAPRIIFGIEQGALFCHMGNGSSGEVWKNIVSSSTNTWEYYVLVKNGATCTYYKNGALLSSHTYAYNPSIGGAENGNEYCIGMNEGGTNNIKDYIIENRIWTSEQVANYYNQTKTNYEPSLKSYEEIVAMATSEGYPRTNTIAELNIAPTDYYNMLNSEGYMVFKAFEGYNGYYINGIMYSEGGTTYYIAYIPDFGYWIKKGYADIPD